MIRFLEPGWLLLLLPILALFPRISGKTPRRVIHLAVATLAVLAMSQPQIQLDSQKGKLVVLCDRSASMPPDADSRLAETIGLLEEARPNGSGLGIVTFGRQVAVERAASEGRWGGFTTAVDPSGSRLAEAIRDGLSLIEPGTSARMLVVSDGKVDPLSIETVSAEAIAQEVAVDFRYLARDRLGDLAIEQFVAPQAVAPKEAFLLSAWAVSDREREVEFTLRRGSAILAQGKRKLVSGRNRFLFRDVADQTGAREYELQLEAPGDTTPENNRARAIVSVDGPKPILHLFDGATRMGDLLREGGLSVESISGEAFQNGATTLSMLGRYSAVILENVSADRLGLSGMEIVRDWVTHTGGGLWMTGGKNAYAVGGYYQSPLEPILPVSMETRKERRKVSVAIAVVLDRSGSMGASVGFGKTKMDLANLGTAQVYDLLTPIDEFACIAVDSLAQTVVPLSPVNPKDSTREKVLSIETSSGGIFVYEGLKAAVRELKKSNASIRHIILFADAADAEEPGEYQKLLGACRKAGVTCSVIGLGTPADVDADLLVDVAQVGGGRSFFTNQPTDLPRLFAHDTFVVSKNSFVDTPVSVAPTAGLTLFTDKTFDSIPKLGGYNMNFLRPDATLAMLTQEKDPSPILAGWHRGLGRVLCYTGEVDGKFTGKIGRWDQFGQFLTTLGRWTAGRDQSLPPTMLAVERLEGETAQIRLYLDPDRAGDPFKEMPKVHTLQKSDALKATQAKTFSMQWEDPDTLVCEVPIDTGEVLLASVEVPGCGRARLAPICLPYSPEYRPPRATEGLPLLRKMANATGGDDRRDLAGIWADLPEKPRYFALLPWLALTAVVLILLEVLTRRTGWLTWVTRRRKTIPGNSPNDTKTTSPIASKSVASQSKRTKKRRPRKTSSSATAESSDEFAKNDAAPKSPSLHPERAEDDLLGAIRKARSQAKKRNDR